MNHTEGKLKLVLRNAGIADTGDYEGIVEARDAINRILFQMIGEDDIDEADARRLVACWNLCTGMDTELLETIIRCGDTLEARFSDFVKKVDERDEALEVLKLVGSDITTTLYKLNKETEARVNTILSKHKDKP